jgi:AraC family transcriptional regulator, positive regulator of tynA and feaB
MPSPLKQWSTDAVQPQQRLGYWMDAICDSFLEMRAKPARVDGFFGHITHNTLGVVGVNEVLGSAQTVDRDAPTIAKSTANYYYLITQLGSPWGVRHAGQSHLLAPGDSILIDSRLAYEFTFPTALHHLSLQLPIDWLERWLPQPAAALGRPVDGSSGWGAALRSFKEAMTPQFAQNPALPAQLVTDQLGALLALAYGATPADQASLRSAHARCLQTMRQRLSESGLVASEVARSSAVSLRSLHRAFAARGDTFAAALRQMRLQEAQRMLGDRRFAAMPLAEIGLRCGYADASHFAKQVRMGTGLTAGALRSRLLG